MTHMLPLTKELLRSRAHELLVYLQFLRIALEKDAHVSALGDRVQLPLDKALTHMMKANVCLLLYSAMEACMVQLLDEMHDIIGQNCQGADQLNNQLVLMVARHFKASKTNLTTENTSSPLHENLFKTWLVDWQDRNQREKRQAGLSGSVGSLAIFDRLRRFGVFPADLKKPPAHLTHGALQSTKGRRNQLAHGERSFADLGQDLAFEELCRDALAVFRTLRRVAQEVNVFLQQRRYLAAPALALIEA
uniref:MAE_28990/MAE_18760 family HEPN-like nuclease n=1 Tax=uncultured Acidovorax sp. TaxID=158751 RepID=UPI0025D0B126|nr:MAE_28990/MAE_18760 family HEPN-like nuclease [uncultured Acidovorax sp.]